jgi:hypothetical protein
MFAQKITAKIKDRPMHQTTYVKLAANKYNKFYLKEENKKSLFLLIIG